MKAGRRYFRARVRALLAKKLATPSCPDLEQIAGLLVLIYRAD